MRGLTVSFGRPVREDLDHDLIARLEMLAANLLFQSRERAVDVRAVELRVFLARDGKRFDRLVLRGPSVNLGLFEELLGEIVERAVRIATDEDGDFAGVLLFGVGRKGGG